MALLAVAVDAAVAVGELDAARLLCRRLDADAAASCSRFGSAAAERGRGQIAAGAGDADVAIGHLRTAADAFLRVGLPMESARTNLALGALLRRRGQRRSAQEALQAARDTFVAFGLDGLCREVDAEVARLGVRRNQDAGQLTASERQVAALVALGLRNSEVAASLYVSVKTVETHLSRVYRKLDVRGRGELIATADRRDTAGSAEDL
jgi:DNA-binding CsgD family transcriptional regulator